jgi:hypothetical protein
MCYQIQLRPQHPKKERIWPYRLFRSFVEGGGRAIWDFSSGSDLN